MQLMAAPFELFTSQTPGSQVSPVCLPVSKGDSNEAVMDGFSLCPVFSLQLFESDSFWHLGPIAGGWGCCWRWWWGERPQKASQSLLGCAPSYDMPFPFPVTAAKTRRKPVGRQASQLKWITGVIDVHRCGGSWAGPGGLCGARILE